MNAEMGCRGCQQPIAKQCRSGFCPACRPTHCCTCGREKLPSVDPRCRFCLRAAHDRRLLAPGRQCRWCKKETTPKDYYCSECRAGIEAYQRDKRKARKDPRCGRCAKPLRPGSAAIRCAFCKRLEKRLSRRHCGWCGNELKPEEHARCKYCRKDERRIDHVLATQGILSGPPARMRTDQRSPRARADLDRSVWIGEYQRGDTLQQIADRAGCSYLCVRSWLSDRIELRPRGRIPSKSKGTVWRENAR